MRVPVYNEQLRYSTRQKGGRLDGVQYDGRIASQSQAQLGKALSGLGNALGQAGEQIYRTNYRLDEADAQRALTEYQKAFLAKQTEIFKLKGEQALKANEDFASWQTKAKDNATRNLSERARTMFDTKAGAVFESNKQWVSNYQAGQEEVYMDSIFQANMDTERDVYLQNINNPQLMEEARQRIFASIQEYGLRKGMPKEAIKQLYKDTMEKNSLSAVQMHIDSGDLRKARTLLDYNKDFIGADSYAKTKKQIQTEQEVLNAKWEKQQAQARQDAFDNQLNATMSMMTNMIVSQANIYNQEEMSVMVDDFLKGQTGNDYAMYEKARERADKIIKNQYAQKEKYFSVFGQELLNADGTEEQKIQLIQDARTKGNIDQDTANLLEKTILQQDYKTTDYDLYDVLTDNILNGTYQDYNAFLSAANSVQMTYDDRKKLFDLYDNRNSPVLKMQNEEDKEVKNILNFSYKNPDSQSESMEFAQKRSQNNAIYDYMVRQFTDANGRYPNLAEKQDIARQIIDKEAITVPMYQGESNASFIEVLEDIGEAYTEATGKTFNTEQQLSNARIVLQNNSLPVSNENVLRILGAEDVNKELADIRQGKESESVDNYVLFEDSYNFDL